MEEKLNEALDNAGITEEDLTANGEAARKAMEAKAEHAAASEAKIAVVTKRAANKTNFFITVFLSVFYLSVTR